MTSARWEHVKPIVADALEIPAAERAAYLDKSCGNDAELRAEVESLIAAAGDGSDSFPRARASIARAAERALTRTHDVARHNDAALRSLLETALGQQYEILRPLGQGGMGAVYLARDTALERLVAIKILRPDLAALEDGRERFRREARIIARLSHPGILPLYTFGEVEGTLYLVMAYVPGVSLAERLRVEGRLSPEETARILWELADALECAHREGVIHRDIKPANILLDDATGHAILADFGIAKVEGGGEPLTSTGMVLGTPEYMSPEQVYAGGGSESAVDERSDVYSLGAVGFTMLAGRTPSASSDESMYARIAQRPVSLEKLAPAVSPELSRIITRCLARDPALRWPNARTLKAALASTRRDAHGPPESVRDLPTFGPYAVLWAIAWTLLSVTLRPPGDRLLLLLIAVLVPLGLALHVGNARRHEVGLAELARIAFWPPEWWGMWWPKSLRRPGDHWRRLPRLARWVRVALSAFIVSLPTVVLLRSPLSASIGLTLGETGTWWVDVIEMALVAGAGATTLVALAWARARDLTWHETVRVLFGPTAQSAAWDSPRLAALLDDTGRVREPMAESAPDHARAIAELVALLPSDAAEMGRSAVAASRRLVDAIAKCETEEAILARESSVEEADRLMARAAALEATEHRDGSDEAELLSLVKRELELVRRLRARGVMAAERRARLFSLLRGLWTQVRLDDRERVAALVEEAEANCQ